MALKLNNRITFVAATVLLVFMFALALGSITKDAVTMDELPHLPAGYSYLTQQDMRLNPEHPPLIKDLAGFPLLFIKDINFPASHKSWKEGLNDQWDFGRMFFYGSGNDADKMIFWGRIPMILVLVSLGAIIFFWTRKLWGNTAALITLFLFSFSPTFLAHGRLVTTDVGAAIGAVIALFFFLNFLKTPTWKNIFWAGIALGIAELLKFSLIFLYPFFGILAVFWVFVNSGGGKIRALGVCAAKYTLVLLTAFVLIWMVYFPHVLNFPPDLQAEYSQQFTKTHPLKQIAGPVSVALSENPALRPIGYYLLGVFMVTERGVGGNTTYFRGEVSRAGWVSFFPIVYAIKEPLTLHILTLLALLYFVWKRPFSKGLRSWSKKHFVEIAMFSWIFIYWASSLVSNLNIGVRHLLPALPFTFMLAGYAASLWLKKPFLKAKYALLVALLLAQAVGVGMVYPHFLAYFNEVAGGPKNGYIHTVDSNLDWGQDLRRLKEWADQNIPADKVLYIDYFGGGDPEYYFGENYESWWGQRPPEEFPKGNYLAVSASFLQSGRGVPVHGFDQPTKYYDWLNSYQPVAKIGHSIFIFQILQII